MPDSIVIYQHLLSGEMLSVQINKINQQISSKADKAKDKINSANKNQ
jgi:hypothetical protein